MLKTCFAALAVAIVVAVSGGAAVAFPEKDVTIIIPNRPGGGFDVYARAAARYMQKHLPNKVNVIPKNVTGAGGRKGTAAIYRSKPDGHTFGILNIPGIVVHQILGRKVAYDVSKMSFIARVSKDKYTIVVPKGSSFKSVADLKKAAKPVRFITMSPGMTQYITSKIAIARLALKAEELTGYRSVRDMMVAVVRGDGEASVTPVRTAIPFFESGDIRPLAFFDKKSYIAGVPTAKDLGYSELALLGLERIFAGPPGIPKDRRKVLESALLKAMADPEMLAWAKQSKRQLSPLPGGEAQRVVAEATELFLGYKQFLGKKKKKIALRLIGPSPSRPGRSDPILAAERRTPARNHDDRGGS